MLLLKSEVETQKAFAHNDSRWKAATATGIESQVQKNSFLSFSVLQIMTSRSLNLRFLTMWIPSVPEGNRLL
ncbi:hypothetical protein O6P43_019546 [Quillaja saponaria]|uniref:Uncharacterized protein n=1 Tax=Quillaja saponaria TaxID=32244 RepID=A0AAD7LIP2_QUISA|nr:hypothetical protein O6P43_019546 [Quillaja saponaria]